MLLVSLILKKEIAQFEQLFSKLQKNIPNFWYIRKPRCLLKFEKNSKSNNFSNIWYILYSRPVIKENIASMVAAC